MRGNLPDAIRIDVMAPLQWLPIGEDMPSGEILLWSGGRAAVGCVIFGVSRGRKWRAYMDARTDEILAEPTHWMALPEPPQP